MPRLALLADDPAAQKAAYAAALAEDEFAASATGSERSNACMESYAAFSSLEEGSLEGTLQVVQLRLS